MPDGTIFYVYPERFKDAVQKEINADFGEIIKLADELKILERADNRNFAKLVRIKNKVIRMLVFNSKVLADEG